MVEPTKTGDPAALAGQVTQLTTHLQALGLHHANDANTPRLRLLQQREAATGAAALRRLEQELAGQYCRCCTG